MEKIFSLIIIASVIFSHKRVKSASEEILEKGKRRDDGGFSYGVIDVREKKE